MCPLEAQLILDQRILLLKLQLLLVEAELGHLDALAVELELLELGLEPFLLFLELSEVIIAASHVLQALQQVLKLRVEIYWLLLLMADLAQRAQLRSLHEVIHVFGPQSVGACLGLLVARELNFLLLAHDPVQLCAFSELN